MTKLLLKTPLSVLKLVAFLFVWHLYLYLERRFYFFAQVSAWGRCVPVNQGECGQIEIYLDRCLSVFQISLDSSSDTNLTFPKLWATSTFFFITVCLLAPCGVNFRKPEPFFQKYNRIQIFISSFYAKFVINNQNFISLKKRMFYTVQWTHSY